MDKSNNIKILYIGFALLIGIFLEFILFEHMNGLGYLIFSILYLAGFIGISYFGKLITNKYAFLLIIPILVFSVNISIYNNDLVSSYLPFFLYVFLFSFSVLLTLKNPEKHSFFLMKIPLFRNVFNSFAHLKEVFTTFSFIDKTNSNETQKKIVLGILYSIPILIIFVTLFIKADLVFESIVFNKIGSLFEQNLSFNILWSLFYSIFIASFFLALSSKKHKLLPSIIQIIKLDKITSMVILGLVNVLFLGFVLIQIRYLFGDVDFVMSNNIIFSEYARHGFFELIQIVVIAFLLIGFFHRSFSHHGKDSTISFLKIALIIQISVIAISALQRMELYQDAYGYTVLRLYVEWFLYTLFFSLVVLIVMIITNVEFKKLCYSFLIIFIVATCVVSSINVDLLIAQKNIEKSINENTNLDYSYLARLSIDAVPAFVIDDPVLNTIANNKIRKLDDYNSIFEYNLGKERAYKLKDLIESKSTNQED